MTREELIQKWLNHSLTAEEYKAFQQLDDYDELMKLQGALQGFQAPRVDADVAYKNVHDTKKDTSKPTLWYTNLLKIAAILIVGFSIYVFATISPNLTTIETVAAHKKMIALPDASTATLNAASSMSFNKESWDEKREITLQGEAYFKVAKGATFNVITDQGEVSVLGTQFNVKQRDRLFEVFCYEGAVRVSYLQKEIVLKPGERFVLLDGKEYRDEKENTKEPSWISNESSFKSLPLREVIQEFERQYDVTVDASQIDTSQIFTGSFTHTDITLALQAITLPSQLKYEKKQNSIILTRD